MTARLIEILGTGCAKCRNLEAAAREAVARLGVPCEVAKVTDIVEIVRRGALMTPALAIDGRIVANGRELRADEIGRLLEGGAS